ncbi:hypothetical protein [Micrococcoides hystricis]|uniref:Uncharacterized protein n=1 Tax=Micrococcoides hystricis TaxID=1572761 RepID=A0ABV6PBB1_9MICC
MGLLMIVHRVPDALGHPNEMMNWPAEHYPPLGSVGHVVQRINDEILDRGMGTQWFDDRFGLMIPYGVESFDGTVHGGQFRWLMVSQPTPELMQLLVDVGGEQNWRMFNAATGEEITPGHQLDHQQHEEPAEAEDQDLGSELFGQPEQVVDVEAEGTPEQQEYFDRLNAATQHVGEILYAALPDNATSMRLTVQTIGEEWMHRLEVDPKGPTPPLPQGLDQPLRDLRQAMYQPGKGAWFQAGFTVDQDAQMDVDYNYDDEPVWFQPPRRGSFMQEVDLFRRDADTTPAWLESAVAAAQVEEQQPTEAAQPEARTETAVTEPAVNEAPVNEAPAPQSFETHKPFEPHQQPAPQVAPQQPMAPVPPVPPVPPQQYGQPQPAAQPYPQQPPAQPMAAPKLPASKGMNVELPQDWFNDRNNPATLMWVEQQFVATALLQTEQAHGAPVQWKVRSAEEQEFLQQLLAQNGIAGITITSRTGQEG